MTEQYTFVVEATISLNVTVSAASLAEAIAKAQKAPAQGLCHQCARGEKGHWNTSGELDCDPTYGPLVEVYVGDDVLDEERLEAVKKQWSET